MAEGCGAGEVDAGGMLPLIWRVNSRLAVPEWRNWYTHQAQNLARFTPHVGSSPTSGTKSGNSSAGTVFRNPNLNSAGACDQRPSEGTLVRRF